MTLITKQVLIVTLGLLLQGFSVSAQKFHSKNGLGFAKNKVYAVLLNHPEDESGARKFLAKKVKMTAAQIDSTLAEHRVAIDSFNSRFQRVLQTEWSNLDIEFIDYQAHLKLVKRGDKRGISLIVPVPSGWGGYPVAFTGTRDFKNKLAFVSRYYSKEGFLCSSRINIAAGVLTKAHACSYVGLLMGDIYTGSIFFGIRELTLRLDRQEANFYRPSKETIQSRAHFLQERELVIWDQRLQDSLDAEELAKIYPYRFRVVDRQTYDSIMISKSPDYVILVVFSDLVSGRQHQAIFLCEEPVIVAVPKAYDSSRKQRLDTPHTWGLHRRHLDGYLQFSQ
jgi:hypothetical protein